LSKKGVFDRKSVWERWEEVVTEDSTLKIPETGRSKKRRPLLKGSNKESLRFGRTGHHKRLLRRKKLKDCSKKTLPQEDGFGMISSETEGN